MIHIDLKQKRWLCCLICFLGTLSGASIAQLSSGSYFLEGNIAFWNQGVAVLNTDGRDARIDETGSFNFFLSSLPSNDLSPVREYDGADCLTASNPDSMYKTIFYFDVFRSNDFIAELYLQSPRFDTQLGEAVKEFHYYSEATNVSGRCVIDYDDGTSAIYVFQNLEMKQGWNELTGIVQEVTENTTTYVLNLDDDAADFRWEVEASSLDDNETYQGIGAHVDHADRGMLLSSIDTEGPADQAGLKSGDIITHIDGEAAHDMNVGAAVLRLRGTAGTTVSLRVLREGQVLEVTVNRGIVSTNP